MVWLNADVECWPYWLKPLAILVECRSFSAFEGGMLSMLVERSQPLRVEC